jgi:membrane-bound serine protease (ClpP class)
LLIGLAFLMFILEIKVTSFGLLTIGGILSMLLGSLMLIDSPEEYLRIPLPMILVVVGTTSAVFTFIIGAAMRSVGRQPVSGMEGILGETGIAKQRLDPLGTVFVQGTLWTARSTAPIEVGEAVRVIGVEGLKLTVEKVTEEE